jgi:Cu-Zn family superoxide dismutase
VSKFFGALVLAGVLAAGAAQGVSQSGQAQPNRAVAVLFPTEGSIVQGTVSFVAEGSGLRVTGEVHNLPPNSTHGFHVHEFGDMTKEDGMAMGSHFNPSASAHGLPHNGSRHTGDMGNVTADEHGIAKIDAYFDGMALSGRGNVLGRGVVVHDKPDDGGQPVGNAGARIAFGVIGVAKPEG